MFLMILHVKLETIIYFSVSFINSHIILVDGEEICVKKYVYLMLNKPKGYVSATEDRDMATGYQLHKVFIGTALLLRDLSHCVQHKSGAVLVKE